MAVRNVQNAKTLARLVSRVGGQQNHTAAAQQQRQEKQNDQEKNGQGTWAALGLGLLGAGLAFTAPILAEEGKKKMFGKNLPDRVRQYATADNVFDHFATYQLVNDVGGLTKCYFAQTTIIIFRTKLYFFVTKNCHFKYS